MAEARPEDRAAPSRTNNQVFVNCPFDAGYRPLFEAIVFAIYDCGFTARCVLEVDDSSQVRIDKICDLIAACRLGIHDLSRTEVDAASPLPRFNMPLELGLFLGAKRFGAGAQKRKTALILEREPFLYHKTCSDIAGQDTKAHHGDPSQAIRHVRDWLRADSKRQVPSSGTIIHRHDAFRRDLPELCRVFRLDESDPTFKDFSVLAAAWLKEHPW